jgi:hypothetical protein
MTNQEFVFGLLVESKLTSMIRGITKNFSHYLPPIRGEILEHIVAESLHKDIRNFKAGSREQQRDFSIVRKNGVNIRISMKSGRVKGKKIPLLSLNGSRMGGKNYKTLVDRVETLNDKYFDGILSCTLNSNETKTRYESIDFRYITPRIFPVYRVKDFESKCKSCLTHKAENGIITTITPRMAHLVWYHIPTEIITKNLLTIPL